MSLNIPYNLSQICYCQNHTELFSPKNVLTLFAVTMSSNKDKIA